MNQLLENVEASVDAMLAYLEGNGAASQARVGDWSVWEVACHLLYWHDATAWGIESASGGGPPWPLPGGPDEVNEASVRLHEGERLSDIIAQLRRTQERLVRAASRSEDLSRPAFVRPSGETVSVGDRLAMIARHWRGHLEELRAAG